MRKAIILLAILFSLNTTAQKTVVINSVAEVQKLESVRNLVWICTDYPNPEDVDRFLALENKITEAINRRLEKELRKKE